MLVCVVGRPTIYLLSAIVCCFLTGAPTQDRNIIYSVIARGTVILVEETLNKQGRKIAGNFATITNKLLPKFPQTDGKSSFIYDQCVAVRLVLFRCACVALLWPCGETLLRLCCGLCFCVGTCSTSFARTASNTCACLTVMQSAASLSHSSRKSYKPLKSDLVHTCTKQTHMA